MTHDTCVPLFLCVSCGKQSYPLGRKPMRLPILQVPVTCPFCEYKTNYEWISSDVQNEILKKKAGLTDLPLQEMNVMKKSIESLEAKIGSLSKDIELLNTKLDVLTIGEIQKIKDKSNDQTGDINSLIEKVNEIKEKVDFQEGNK